MSFAVSLFPLDLLALDDFGASERDDLELFSGSDAELDEGLFVAPPLASGARDEVEDDDRDDSFGVDELDLDEEEPLDLDEEEDLELDDLLGVLSSSSVPLPLDLADTAAT